MTFRMLFGLVVSSGLALGVLKLFGFLNGAPTLFEIGAGILLTVIYFGAFRSALTGRARANEAPGKERMIREEMEAVEDGILQPAA